MGSVAQYVVFLCSCHTRILFFHTVFFVGRFLLFLILVSLIDVSVCILHSFTSLYTCTGILQDLLWLSAPNSKWGEKSKHLSIYAITKNNTFWEFFFFIFSFYVGQWLYYYPRFNDLFFPSIDFSFSDARYIFLLLTWTALEYETALNHTLRLNANMNIFYLTGQRIKKKTHTHTNMDEIVIKRKSNVHTILLSEFCAEYKKK